MDTRDAGRMGGIAKVPKGFSALSAEERSEAARKGAVARWGKKKGKKSAGKSK
jgi:hypothetical protein